MIDLKAVTVTVEMVLKSCSYGPLARHEGYANPGHRRSLPDVVRLSYYAMWDVVGMG